MNRIKHRTNTELKAEIYLNTSRQAGMHYKFIKEPIDEKAKESFNRPAYQGLFSKRSDKK